MRNHAGCTTMGGMRRFIPRTGRRAAIAVVLAAPLVACSASEEATPATSLVSVPGVDEVVATGATDVVATDAVDAAVTSNAPAPSTVAVAPTTSETLPDEVVVTTTSIPLPATTTTTEPLSVTELVLRGDSLGSAFFGAETQGVIDYVGSILGGNTADTGWVDPFTFGSCGDTVARRVQWGSLALVFSDLSPYASGRRHFIGWEYGVDGQIGTEPVGLRTPGGVTLGSRVVDLLAEFPDAAINPGEDDIGAPPNFYVSDFFRGLLTGPDGDDVVTVMFGGYGCAE